MELPFQAGVSQIHGRKAAPSIQMLETEDGDDLVVMMWWFWLPDGCQMLETKDDDDSTDPIYVY